MEVNLDEINLPPPVVRQFGFMQTVQNEYNEYNEYNEEPITRSFNIDLINSPLQKSKSLNSLIHKSISLQDVYIKKINTY